MEQPFIAKPWELADLLLKVREEQAQRDRIRRMFGSYVSPELVRRMVDARAEPQLGGHESEITAFFSDIQGFSAFSEVLSPADLVVLLNEYLGAMTDILQEEGGALDKYIGDAIVAMFGGLVPLPNHAARACEAVAKMQRRQAELRAAWQAQGDRWPPLVKAMRTRIGLNSGQVVVGNMGSHHRFNYTMMGDVVNLAARCESGAKAFGVYSLATENTVREAQAAGCACVFRSLDRIVVKGRSVPVEIFEVVGLTGEVTAETHACLAKFAEGRAHYLKQAWGEAAAAFAEAAKLEPLQQIARIRIILCDIDARLARTRHIARGLADAIRERFHLDPDVQAAREGRDLPLGDYDPPHLNLPTLTVDTSDGCHPAFESIVAFASP